MGRFINPFTDYGFKFLFGREVEKELLIDFLNDLLVGEHVITDIQFLNSEQQPEVKTERGLIYDIYCVTDTGERIIVEMQNRSQINFKDRALFYLSKAIVSQGVAGSGWMFDIKAVYGVFFMNFLLDGEEPKLRTDVILSDRDTGRLFSDKLRQIFIALPVFEKDEEQCETDFDRWIYVLKNMNLFDMSPFKEKEAYFRRLLDVANVNALSPKERATYDENLKIYRDWKATMEYAVEEAETKGKAEGERLATLRNARNMKKAGVALSLVAECTGLSLEIIQSL